MSIKVIPLSRLEADPQAMLSERLDSGESLAWIPTGKKTANGITALPACFSL
jgi:hypothetical protein